MSEPGGFQEDRESVTERLAAEALIVDVDGFEGPLDLLLMLSRTQKVDLRRISVLQLAEQYLKFVNDAKVLRIELAADYLVMAAWLAYLKSRLLLPRPPRPEEDEEPDPRAELVRRLLEYEQVKLASMRLDALPRVERDFEWVGVFVAEKVVERLPEVSLHDLQLAWLKIARQARLKRHHTIQREEMSVREHMTLILRRLRDDSFVVFESLFDPKLGVASLVVSFLATLELVKERLVVVTQNEAFAPIYVKRADSATGDA